MRLIPKEDEFFDLFEELVNIIEEGGELFLDLVEHYAYSDQKIAKLKELEHEADVITRNTYEKMHKTFLTPIDREDICDLVNNMDSILDMVEASATRMSLYKVKVPAREIIDQARILNNAIKKVKYIVYAIRNMKNAKTILDNCVEIHTLENEGDIIMRSAMVDLFEHEKDAIELIKIKEILQTMERGADRIEDVADVLKTIMIKVA